MTARRHHYLPQCYLKGFAHHREKPRLFVVDGKTGKSFSTHPVNIAQQRDFHAVQVEGMASDALEQVLAMVEGEIAPALERIGRTGSLRHGDDRTLVLNLAALIAVKNPRHRETMRDFSERMGKQLMRLALETPERWEAQVRGMKEAGVMSEDEPLDYENMRAFVDSNEYRIDMETGAHLAMELTVFDNVLPLFIDRHWAVLRAPRKSSGFVTCDHPVSLYWSEVDRNKGFYPPGHGLTGTTVAFPISKEVALMGTFEQPEDIELDLSAGQVADFNAQTISGAERQVFARDGDFTYRSGWTGMIRRGVDLPSEILNRRQRTPGRKSQGGAE